MKLILNYDTQKAKQLYLDALAKRSHEESRKTKDSEMTLSKQQQTNMEIDAARATKCSDLGRCIKAFIELKESGKLDHCKTFEDYIAVLNREIDNHR